MSAVKLHRYSLRHNPFALAAMALSLLPAGCATCSTGVCETDVCGPPAVGCVDDGGCGHCGDGMLCAATTCDDVPRELQKTNLPEYRIEPPDILLIEAVNNLRPSFAPVHAGEPLIVQVNRTIPFTPTEEPVSQQFKQINGIYVIGTDGYLNLGPEYGKVLVAEQNLEEIQRRVEMHLKRILTNPQVLVTLPNPQNYQYVAGPHLVRPDGTVGLGIYGSLNVTGLTLAQAKCELERHLSQHIHNPQVSVDVLAYNSKVYYVITDGGGAGEQVYRLPSTGNETVLDAIANVRGLPTVASRGSIWIARPAPESCRPDQILPVNWDGVARGAETCTNYQVLPGDRIYVKADKFITFDTNLSKITAPFERLFGFVILGNGTVRTLQRGANGFGTGGGF
ncbi:MAG: polysaccharide biosynthesis/export family protein [Planctomycetaceae bacterium]|nr:polysaccharide biosynthesis/export family protein [Planctomycetaceae bacterium]